MQRNWRRVRDKLGGKWKVPILQVLLVQPQRFNKLRVLLKIHAIVLQRALRQMAAHGLVIKEGDLYSITELGAKAVKCVIKLFELL